MAFGWLQDKVGDITGKIKPDDVNLGFLNSLGDASVAFGKGVAENIGTGFGLGTKAIGGLVKGISIYPKAAEYGVRKLFGEETAQKTPLGKAGDFLLGAGEGISGFGDTVIGKSNLTGIIPQDNKTLDFAGETLETAGSFSSSHLIPAGAAIKGVGLVSKIPIINKSIQSSKVVRYGFRTGQAGAVSLPLTAIEAASEANEIYDMVLSKFNGDQDMADIRSSIAFKENFELLFGTNIISIPLLLGGSRVFNAIKRGDQLLNGTRAVTSKTIKARIKSVLGRSSSLIAGSAIESVTELLQQQISDKAFDGFNTKISDFKEKLDNTTPEDRKFLLMNFLASMVSGGATGGFSVDYSGSRANGKATSNLVDKISRQKNARVEFDTKSDAEVGASVLEAFIGSTIQKNKGTNPLTTINTIQNEVKENGVSKIYSETGKTKTFSDNQGNRSIIKIPTVSEIGAFLLQQSERIDEISPLIKPTLAAGALGAGAFAGITDADAASLAISSGALGAADSSPKNKSTKKVTETQDTGEPKTLRETLKTSEGKRLANDPTLMRYLLSSEGKKAITKKYVIDRVANSYVRSLPTRERTRLESDLMKQNTTLTELILKKKFDNSFVGRRVGVIYEGIIEIVNLEGDERIDAISRIKIPDTPTERQQQSTKYVEEFEKITEKKTLERDEIFRNVYGYTPQAQAKNPVKRFLVSTNMTRKKLVRTFRNELIEFSPKLWGTLERMEQKITNLDNRFLDSDDKSNLAIMQEVDQVVKTLSKEETIELDHRAAQGDVEYVKETLNKISDGKNLGDRYFEAINEIGDRLNVSGVIFNRIENYIPRNMTQENYKKFLKYLSTKEPYKTRILNYRSDNGVNKLTEKQIQQLVRSASEASVLKAHTDPNYGKKIKDRIRARTIENPETEILGFYSSFRNTSRIYFHKMNRLLAKSEMLKENNALVTLSGDKEPNSKNVSKLSKYLRDNPNIAKALEGIEGNDSLSKEIEEYNTADSQIKNVDMAASGALLINKFIKQEGKDISDIDMDFITDWMAQYLERKVTGKETTVIAMATYITTLGGLADAFFAILDTGHASVHMDKKTGIFKGLYFSGIKGKKYARIEDYLDTGVAREMRSDELSPLGKMKRLSESSLIMFREVTNSVDQILSTSVYEGTRTLLLKGKVSQRLQIELDGLFTKEEQVQLKEDMKNRKRTELTITFLAAKTNSLLGHNFLSKSYTYHKYNSAVRLAYTLRSYYIASFMGLMGRDIDIIKNKSIGSEEKRAAIFRLIAKLGVIGAETFAREAIYNTLKGKDTELTVEKIAGSIFWGTLPISRHSLEQSIWSVGALFSGLFIPIDILAGFAIRSTHSLVTGDFDELARQIIRRTPFVQGFENQLVPEKPKIRLD